MLAYAPRPQRQRMNPAALALIVGVHAVAIAAVMSAKIHYDRQKDPPIIVKTIELPMQTPAELPEQPQRQPANKAIDLPTPMVPLPPLPGPTVQDLPLVPTPDPLIGGGLDVPPLPAPLVRTGPRFATPGLRYPAALPRRHAGAGAGSGVAAEALD